MMAEESVQFHRSQKSHAVLDVSANALIWVERQALANVLALERRIDGLAALQEVGARNGARFMISTLVTGCPVTGYPPS